VLPRRRRRSTLRRGGRAPQRRRARPVHRAGDSAGRQPRGGGLAAVLPPQGRTSGRGLMQALLDDIGFVIVATGVLTGASAALLGTFLVVRGQAMLSDAISHGVVFGVALTFLLTGAVAGPVQLIGAAAAGLLTVLLTEALAGSGKVKRDAATGLVFPALFAAGILLLNLFARNAHVDVHTVLLGEIGFVWLDRIELLGLQVPRALAVATLSLLLNAVYVTLFHKELTAAAFDPVMARLQGL